MPKSLKGVYGASKRKSSEREVPGSVPEGLPVRELARNGRRTGRKFHVVSGIKRREYAPSSVSLVRDRFVTVRVNQGEEDEDEEKEEQGDARCGCWNGRGTDRAGGRKGGVSRSGRGWGGGARDEPKIRREKSGRLAGPVLSRDRKWPLPHRSAPPSMPRPAHNPLPSSSGFIRLAMAIQFPLLQVFERFTYTGCPGRNWTPNYLGYFSPTRTKYLRHGTGPRIRSWNLPKT